MPPDGFRFPAVDEAVHRLVELVRTGRGFTVDPHTGVAPTTGYAVATGEGTRIEPVRTFLDGDGPRVVRAFVVEHGAALVADPQLVVGAWHDVRRNRVVLSLVRVVPDRDGAVALALACGQRAVHDLAAGRDVGTGLAG